jgi:small basic protein (TIGR04137 family)
MSVHKSLRTGGSLNKHRNVLTRSERIKFLEEAGNWREGSNSVLGLRKVKSIKLAAKKKAKKEAAAEGAGAAASVAAPAADAKAGAGAKAAAPAAGGKAAPAAKPAAKK